VVGVDDFALNLTYRGGGNVPDVEAAGLEPEVIRAMGIERPTPEEREAIREGVADAVAGRQPRW
jgi:hypothetical protein